MRKIYRIALSTILILVLSVTCAFASVEDAMGNVTKVLCDKAGCEPGELLAQEDWAEPGNSASDWLAYLLAINGVQEDYCTYLNGLEQYVTDMYEEQGGLHSVLATEYHRVALTVMALGGDPTAFGKNADGEPVDLIADGTWNFEAGVGKQGVNGLVYALITLDSKGFETPEDSEFSREWLLSEILKEQNEDGGFGLVPGTSDCDMTAMTLTALAPYKDKLGEAIDKAISYLSESQAESGMYESFGDANPESISQVIIALSTLGIDPETDERFIKGGNTLIEGLDKFRLEDGTYSHIQGEDWDLMATEQALLALTAIDRYRSGQPGIYDLSVYELAASDEAQQGQTGGVMPAIIAVVLIAAAVIIFLYIRSRKCRK